VIVCDTGERASYRPECDPAAAHRQAAGVLAAVIVANLDQVADDLAAGALVVIGNTRIRSRLLPVKSAD
jgi:hypothetical protein